MWERAPFFSRSLDLSVSRLKWFFSLEISGQHIFMFYHFCFVVSDTRSTHHTSSGSSSMIMITMRLFIDQVHHLKSNYCQDNYLESSVLFLVSSTNILKTKATTNPALMKKVGDNGPITIPTTATAGSLLVRQDPNSNVRSELFHWITPLPSVRWLKTMGG